MKKLTLTKTALYQLVSARIGLVFVLLMLVGLGIMVGCPWLTDDNNGPSQPVSPVDGTPSPPPQLSAKGF